MTSFSAYINKQLLHCCVKRKVDKKRFFTEWINLCFQWLLVLDKNLHRVGVW